MAPGPLGDYSPAMLNGSVLCSLIEPGLVFAFGGDGEAVGQVS